MFYPVDATRRRRRRGDRINQLNAVAKLTGNAERVGQLGALQVRHDASFSTFYPQANVDWPPGWASEVPSVYDILLQRLISPSELRDGASNPEHWKNL